MAINFDDAFTKNYMDSMYPQPPEEPAQDTMLAAGPVTSDAPQAFVGTRLNVPKAGQPQPTTQDRQRLGIQLFDALAAMPKGAVQATVGLPGDLESIGRTVLDYFGYNVNQETALPTSEDISKKLESTFGPVVPKGQTTIVPTAERERAAKSGETVGEFLPAPGIPEAVVRGGKLIRRGIQATKDMPVGMSTQIVGEGVSDLGFYSAAKQAVDSIQQPKGTGEQFLKQIEKTPGVKPEEIKWTGLDDFLKSKKSVTKAEVQEFLDKNRVEVKEVQLGGGYATMEKELNRQGYELNVDMDGDWSIFKNNEYVEFEELPQDLQQFIKDNGPQATETKFSKYTLPGGENYREILITLPEKPSPFKTFVKSMGEKYGGDTPRNQWSPEDNSTYESLLKGFSSEKQPFRSGHFDQPNILAHMRVNDRVDKDGKKVLFIEEVQSDWHQAGRKKGYETPETKAAMQKKVDELEAERNQLYVEQARLEKLAEPFTSQGKDAPSDILDKWNAVSNRLNNLSNEWASAKNYLATGGNLVPNAPFKTTWHELAMKRAIQLAAEGGYDRVAFTTGKTQAERYDLSKEISRITYTEAGVLRAYDKSDNMVLSKKLESPDQIEDYIGKEPAKKLLEKEVGKVNVDKKYTGPGMEFDGRELSGVDLQIGGEGMKGFYDQILPKFLDKYAKKWDAKTGVTDIPVAKGKPADYANLDAFINWAKNNGGENWSRKEFVDVWERYKNGERVVIVDNWMNSNPGGKEPVRYIDVTPKMKESVLTKGQPLFAIGAGGAAVQQEENQ